MNNTSSQINNIHTVDAVEDLTNSNVLKNVESTTNYKTQIYSQLRKGTFTPVANFKTLSQTPENPTNSRKEQIDKGINNKKVVYSKDDNNDDESYTTDDDVFSNDSNGSPNESLKKQILKDFKVALSTLETKNTPNEEKLLLEYLEYKKLRELNRHEKLRKDNLLLIDSMLNKIIKNKISENVVQKMFDSVNDSNYQPQFSKPVPLSAATTKFPSISSREGIPEIKKRKLNSQETLYPENNKINAVHNQTLGFNQEEVKLRELLNQKNSSISGSVEDSTLSQILNLSNQQLPLITTPAMTSQQPQLQLQHIPESLTTHNNMFNNNNNYSMRPMSIPQLSTASQPQQQQQQQQQQHIVHQNGTAILQNIHSTQGPFIAPAPLATQTKFMHTRSKSALPTFLPAQYSQPLESIQPGIITPAPHHASASSNLLYLPGQSNFVMNQQPTTGIHNAAAPVAFMPPVHDITHNLPFQYFADQQNTNMAMMPKQTDHPTQ